MIKNIVIKIEVGNCNNKLTIRLIREFSAVNFERLREFIDINLSGKEKEKLIEVMQSFVNQLE